MDHLHLPFPGPLEPGSLPTALAPMQDVTDLPFMRLLGKYGAPDYFFTEYFRVHSTSVPEAHIADSILHHGTGLGLTITKELAQLLAMRDVAIAGVGQLRTIR